MKENLDFDHKLVGDQFIAGMKGIKEMTDQSQSAREMVEMVELAHRLTAHAIRYANDYGYGIATDLNKAAASLRLAAQAAPGEPVAWREAIYKAVLIELEKKRPMPTSTILALDITNSILAIPAALPQDDRDPATIEACAKFVGQHQERISETANGSERSLSPRKVGNQMGLAYVNGIRALSSKGK